MIQARLHGTVSARAEGARVGTIWVPPRRTSCWAPSASTCWRCRGRI